MSGMEVEAKLISEARANGKVEERHVSTCQEQEDYLWFRFV